MSFTRLLIVWSVTAYVHERACKLVNFSYLRSRNYIFVPAAMCCVFSFIQSNRLQTSMIRVIRIFRQILQVHTLHNSFSFK